MKKADFDKLDLSPSAQRLSYPNLEIAFEAMAYRNERFDYWASQEGECPYTRSAEDQRRKYGHLLKRR